MAIPVSGVNNWLTLNKKPLLFAEGEENLAAGATEYRYNFFRLTPNAVVAGHQVEIFIDQVALESEHYGYWQWRPEEYAGLYEIRVQVKGTPLQITRVRVQPHKLTQRRYQKMQADLSEIAADLLFRLHSPAHEHVAHVKRFQETSPLHDYKQIKSLMLQLQDTLAHIRRDPYYVLNTTIAQHHWQEVQQFSGDIQPVGGEIVRHHNQVGKTKKIIHLPMTWDVRQTNPSYDVYENRLLKKFIQKQLIARLTLIQQRAQAEVQLRTKEWEYKQRHGFKDAVETEQEVLRLQHVVDDCLQMKQRCIHWCSEHFLAKVKSEIESAKATQVLLKHPYYSRFYQLYLQLQQQQLQISLSTNAYLAELNVRKVSAQYEMWSVFQITRLIIQSLLDNGYTSNTLTLFYEVEKNYFQFDVRKNKASIILTKEGTRVEIKYEPIYPNHKTTQQAGLVATIPSELPLTPDMSVEIYQQGRPYSVLIFDAKYRWQKVSNGYAPQEEDMGKMHRYKANICYQTYDQKQRRFRPRAIVKAAFALYPGNQVFIEGDGTVGGLPLTPNMSPKLLQKVKDELINMLTDSDL